MIDDRLDGFSYVPGPDRPLLERVEYVQRRAVSELEFFAEEYGAERVQDLPLNTFTSALRHCCKVIFRPALDGKKEDYFKLDLGDKELIFALSQMFIDLCDRYNKVCQIDGLAAFLGVSRGFLYGLSRYGQTRYELPYNNIYSDNHSEDNNSYLDDNIKGNNKYNNIEHMNNYSYVGDGLNPGFDCDVIKGLKEAKERQLQSLLIDGKGQLVGVIAILNHEFGYSKQDGFVEPSVNLTSAERQKTLADKYRVSALPDKLSDN